HTLRGVRELLDALHLLRIGDAQRKALEVPHLVRGLHLGHELVAATIGVALELAAGLAQLALEHGDGGVVVRLAEVDADDVLEPHRDTSGKRGVTSLLIAPATSS